MNILFLDGYFEPEQTPFTHLEADILNGLIAAGHKITVVCPIPTRGIDRETIKEYSKIKSEERYNGKVSVKRFWAPQEKSGTISRMLRYLWCNIRQYATAKKIKNIDIILADSTPPTQGLVARKLKKKIKIPVVYNLQDIFPDSLANAGMTKRGSLIWKIGRRIENKTYAAAERIIVISEDFKKNILAKGVPEEKIEVVYNWIDIESIKPVEKEKNKLFSELGIDRNKFTVVYAGNMGSAQGVDVILDAAELLKNDPEIQFILFGGGAKFEEIRKEAQRRKLNNLCIFALLPQDRVSEVYSLGNVALITCKKGFGNSAFPSKTWSIMACNTPIIASYDLDSELADVLEEAKAGITIAPENAGELVRAILQAKDQRVTVDCREYLQEKCDRKTCARKYVDIFENTVRQGKNG